MPRQSLPYVRFPVGDMTKDEVRAHALRLGLPNAGKPESQEICFIPDGDHAAFVALRAPVRKGPIVDRDGRVLGQHDGIHRYTIGQRRGLGSLPVFPPGADAGKVYVTAIDPTLGSVTVGARADLDRREMLVDDMQWWGPPPPARAHVQIRHRHPARPAAVDLLEGGRARVIFDDPERAIAPGQAAVFYDGDSVIGGGFIAA